MQLNSLSISQSGRLARVNRTLKEQYGFTIAPMSSVDAKTKLALIEREIATMRRTANGGTHDVELTKKLLVAEGLAILSTPSVSEPMVTMSGPYGEVIKWLSTYVADAVEVGDDFDTAVLQAMREYRSSKWRFPDDECERDVKSKALEMIMDREKNYMNINSISEGSDDVWSRAGMDVSGRFTGDRKAADAYIKKGSLASTLSLEPMDDESGVSYPYGKDALRRKNPNLKESPAEATHLVRLVIKMSSRDAKSARLDMNNLTADITKCLPEGILGIESATLLKPADSFYAKVTVSYAGESVGQDIRAVVDQLDTSYDVHSVKGIKKKDSTTIESKDERANEEIVTEVDDFSDVDAGGGKVTYPRGKNALKKRGRVRTSASSVPGYSELDAGNGRVTYPRGKDALRRGARSRMSESEGLVSNLRKLLETELDQADSIVSAKGVGSDLQEMIEKIGRLQNEQLPNITTQMRDAYGADTAANFQHLTMSSLQGIMDALYAAKDQIDDSVDGIVGNGAVSAPSDLGADLDSDFTDSEVPGAGFGDDTDDIGGDIGDIGTAEVDDALSDIEPLGREMKESRIRALQSEIASLRSKINEGKKV